jgi:hypothetical protein
VLGIWRLTSSRFLDILQIILDQRRHLGRVPIGLAGILRPGKREMPDLSWSLGLLKH